MFRNFYKVSSSDKCIRHIDQSCPNNFVICVRYLLCCATKSMRRRNRRYSDLSSRVRGQSFSLVSSRKYLGDSRREQRSVMRLSVMAGDVRSNTPIKEQETTITLSAYPNGVDESLKSQRISTEPNVRDRLVST